MKYALAISDPFNPMARGVCIPVGSTPTQKIHSFLRFDAVIGTGGVGIVLISPCLANNLPSIFFTNTGYTGNANTQIVPWFSYGTPGTTNGALASGWNSLNLATPYSAATLVQSQGTGSSAGNTYGKIVSAGLRAQYIGTTLNESGLYTCYHEASHASLAGYSPNQIQNFADANVEAITRMPCMQAAFAVDASELNFPENIVPQNFTSATNQLYPFSGGNNTWAASVGSTTGAGIPAADINYAVGTPVMVLVFTGVPGQSIHFEYIMHAEYAGIAAAGAVSATEPDVEGTAMVQTAALQLPSLKLSQPKQSAWSLMFGALKSVARAAIPMVVPAAEAALTALLA